MLGGIYSANILIEWASLMTRWFNIIASAATVSTKAQFRIHTYTLSQTLSLITETEWRIYASADFTLVSNGVYDVHTFSVGWRWIYKDIFKYVLSLCHKLYIFNNINDTNQNSWLIFNQDYNISHMFINRNTAFTVVS